jgi:transcriptional regulator with XRE-family HTH domain
MVRRLSDHSRAARRFKNWSQAELARQLGVTASAVGHWERREASAPSLARLVELAVLTQVAFEWLASGRGPMQAGGAHREGGADESVARIVLCPMEERLVGCFRQAPPQTRALLLELAEHLISHPRPPSTSAGQPCLRQESDAGECCG